MDPIVPLATLYGRTMSDKKEDKGTTLANWIVLGLIAAVVISWAVTQYRQADTDFRRAETEMRQVEVDARRIEVEAMRVDAELLRAKNEAKRVEADLMRAKAMEQMVRQLTEKKGESRDGMP